MTTPLHLAVRGFVHELNRRHVEQIEDAVLEAPTYWGVVELARDRVPAAAESSREEIGKALHRYGYNILAVGQRTYRVLWHSRRPT